MEKYINTLWEVWTYDVWGNAKDGYEVNDRNCVHREYPIRLKIQKENVGTLHEFSYAYPSYFQIRKALGLRRIKIECEGDDVCIYVNASRDGFPCGELLCVSHSSLTKNFKHIPV
jgi:hypothetical protein